MNRLVYGLYSAVRGDRVAWRVKRKRLTILAYHGVCADKLAGEPWMPPFFVTQSAFEQQMDYVQRHGCVLSLSEAIARLKRNDLPDHAISVTFDDGYANNLHAAYPILRKYNIPATLFLATGYVTSGNLFPYDRVQLLDAYQDQELGVRRVASYERLIDYRNSPLDVVFERLETCWRDLRPSLSRDQIETLRPLRPEEIRGFDPAVIEFGAHTHQHCILRNESPARRRSEITESVRTGRMLTGRPITLFSYPNGRPGDYGEPDKQVLRGAGIDAAVTALSGTNRGACDPLELRRYSVSLSHTWHAFVAEVTGLRNCLGRIQDYAGRNGERTRWWAAVSSAIASS